MRVVTTPGSFGMRLLMPGMMSPLVIEALVSVLQRSILELEANLRFDLDRAVVGTLPGFFRCFEKNSSPPKLKTQLSKIKAQT